MISALVQGVPKGRILSREVELIGIPWTGSREYCLCTLWNETQLVNTKKIISILGNLWVERNRERIGNILYVKVEELSQLREKA